MKFGSILLITILIELFLVLFGYISPNSVVGILLGTGNFKTLLTESLLSTTTLVWGATSTIGIVFNNTFFIFLGITAFLIDFVFGMSGIIGIFPVPFGHILYGIYTFIFVWTAIEWWRMRDD